MRLPGISVALCSAFFLSVAAPVPAGAQATGDDAALKVAPGPFQPTLESFKQYKYPDWFRDAKLGIWAHWGPQSVPMAGDWYARQMYQQGSPQYKHHLEHYGHPSKTGWKDVIPLWKAEKWDPERLMGLYTKAGARYFVSMGVHHDNFDLWNSTHNPWNAVKMGPKQDVVGTWQKVAKAHGLKFGVSEHLGASFTWFQDAHKADKTGPLAGVPYDGADPKNEALYHFPAKPGDTEWYSKDPRWQREWYARVTDLIDQYQPDLLYTDGGVPFGNEVGRSMIAHLYNSAAARHGGTPEVVYCCKQDSHGMWAQDLERGVMPGINPNAWQTDTSIGDWFYNKNWKYRGADWVVHMLVDIVSKNGNLLLNVVQRPDGTLDPEAELILKEMTDWMAVNSEAIYGTRPWLIHGEGPVRAKGGHFKEDFAYTAKDLRFTSKGDDTLFAFALGWPTDGQIQIRALAKNADATGTIQAVSLLGHKGELKWEQNADGLLVKLPDAAPSKFAVALKVTGANLRGFKPADASSQVPTVFADPTGNYTLGADDANLKGNLKTENQGGQPNIGFWDSAEDVATWKVEFKEPGTFRVTAAIATPHDGSVIVVDADDQTLKANVTPSGAWDKFTDVDAGLLHVKEAGTRTLRVHPLDAKTWKAINLRSVKLVRTGG